MSDGYRKRKLSTRWRPEGVIVRKEGTEKDEKEGEELTGPIGVTGGDSGCVRRRRVGAAKCMDRAAERVVDRGQGSP